MDLRGGKLIIEEHKDSQDILSGIEGTGLILDIKRRSDLQQRVPNELNPSETLDVLAALGSKVDNGLHGSKREKLDARSAAKTLYKIAGLGVGASAQLGSASELAAEVVEQVVDALHIPETPPTGTAGPQSA